MFGNMPAPGSAGTAIRAPATPPPSMSPQQIQQGIGNIGPISAPGGASKPGAQNIQQIMANLHPQAAAALKAMPRDTMTHLTQAGLMHPGVMRHMYGAGQ
jgi:hypothetical protein